MAWPGTVSPQECFHAKESRQLSGPLKVAAKVTGAGPGVTKEQLLDFFAFSGKVTSIEMKSTAAGEEGVLAYVTFEDGKTLEQALLLTGTELQGKPVIVEKAEDYQPPSGAEGGAAAGEGAAGEAPQAAADAPLLQAAKEAPAGGNLAASTATPVPAPAPAPAANKAQQMVADMLAKGYVVGASAMASAKAFDERHRLSKAASGKLAALGQSAKGLGASASARALDMDKKMGLSDRVTAGVGVVDEQVNSVDARYQLSEKTRGVFSKAEQVVAGALSVGQQKAAMAGQALMGNRYVASGHQWVVGAVGNLSSAAGSVRAQAAEKIAKGEKTDEEASKSSQASESSELKEVATGAAMRVPGLAEGEGVSAIGAKEGSEAKEGGETASANKPSDDGVAEVIKGAEELKVGDKEGEDTGLTGSGPTVVSKEIMPAPAPAS